VAVAIQLRFLKRRAAVVDRLADVVAHARTEAGSGRLETEQLTFAKSQRRSGWRSTYASSVEAQPLLSSGLRVQVELVDWLEADEVFDSNKATCDLVVRVPRYVEVLEYIC